MAQSLIVDPPPEEPPGSNRLESVWDYPRPPRVEPSTRHVRVIVDGVVVADSTRAYRILETSHPPGWYLPPEDVRLDLLERTRRQTACEFMGEATFFRLRDSGTREVDVAWTYPRPLPGYEAVAGYVSFYPGRVDEAWVDDERAAAQPGDFYGGWITSDVADPSTSSGPGTPGR